MNLTWAGPAVLTLAWLAVLIGLRRIPWWLIPACFGTSVAALVLSFLLLAWSGPAGSWAVTDYTDSATGSQQFAADAGWVLLLNTVTDFVCCFVLAVATLLLHLSRSVRRSRNPPIASTPKAR